MRLQLRSLLLLAVGLGVLFRTLAVILQAVSSEDGAEMAVMGASFASGREFLMPYENVGSAILEPRPSHHFGPMWSVVLAGAYRMVGYSVAATMATSLLISLVLILIVFLTTKDLMGTEKAWIVTAIVSLDFFLIWLAGHAYSETLLVVFYVPTIWAILRGLKDERYVVLAALFAAAGYLTKSAMGYFFVLAGAIGFLWRFYYMRWAVFRNRYYMAAIAIFITVAGGWALRNVLNFGWPNWETSPELVNATAYATGRPLELFPTLGAKAVLFFVFLGAPGLFFAPQILRSLGQWRDEEVSALLLSIILPAMVGAIIAASFTLTEWPHKLLWPEHLRYITVASVPLLWLALRGAHVPKEIQFRFGLSTLRKVRLPSAKTTLVRILLVSIAGFAFVWIDHMIGFVFLSGALLARPVGEIRAVTIVGLILALGLASANAATAFDRRPELAAGQFLAGIVHDGEVIGLNWDAYHRLNPYLMHPYLANHRLTFIKWDGRNVDLLLSAWPGNFTGYKLVSIFNWTTSVGLLDSMYLSVNLRIRSLLRLAPMQGPPSQGDLFLYRSDTASF